MREKPSAPCANKQLEKKRRRAAEEAARYVFSDCAGCGLTWMEGAELVVVPASNMTFLQGQELCLPCARKHGAC